MLAAPSIVMHAVLLSERTELIIVVAHQCPSGELAYSRSSFELQPSKRVMFMLLGKRLLTAGTTAIEYFVMDVTESGLKKQNEWYSGKKKRSTIKTQVNIEQKSWRIIDVQEAKWSAHDFKLFKDALGREINETILTQVDLGYLGINKFHPLSEHEKAYSKEFSRERFVIERMNARIKIFKSMAYPYGNHCRKHLLRMSLICGFINFEAQL